MSPGVVQVRADICHDCPAPCERQRDGDFHATPCAACPVRRWHTWGECQPGDALAAAIEKRVLGPVERLFPAAAPVVEAVRRCGGCTHAKHQLGSQERHPDAGAPVL